MTEDRIIRWRGGYMRVPRAFAAPADTDTATDTARTTEEPATTPDRANNIAVAKTLADIAMLAAESNPQMAIRYLERAIGALERDSAPVAPAINPDVRRALGWE